MMFNYVRAIGDADNDRLTSLKNWEFRSVYSRNFWRDKEKFVKEIERMYGGGK